MPLPRIRISIGLICLAASVAGPAATMAAEPPPAKIDFNRDIRPILSDNCYFCHGPDKNKRKAELRLDTHDGLFSAIKDHHTVVPGKPAESELFRRITETNADERMPDPKSNKKLSDREITLVKAWIEQGAPWEGHWAYQRPVKATPPSVDQSTFVKNDVDRFVLARLRKAGLSPAAEADKGTLIRRLSFDLTGLPPSAKDVAAFIADTSPDAYEKLVDRLLADPHFGERMAVFWLDLVRFADTIGYHSDNPMNVSPYRDYVIHSFNANKPFDKFTVEQLAGDLLANSTVEQKIATAYNRLLQTTEEGGAAQAKEYESKNLTDRVRNVSTVWMAGTMGCCQCHDHKFDPYTMNDFYSMGAFFADVQETAIGRREAGIAVPTPDQEIALKKLDDALAVSKQKLAKPDPLVLASEQEEWEKNQGKMHVDWKTLDLTIITTGGAVLTKQTDCSYLAAQPIAETEGFTIKARADMRGITGLQIEAFPVETTADSASNHFVLVAPKVDLSQTNARSKPIVIARSTEHAATAKAPTKDDAALEVLSKPGETQSVIVEPATPINADGTMTLGITLKFKTEFAKHQIGRIRLSATTSLEPAGLNSVPTKVRQVLAMAADQRTDKQKALLTEYFQTIAPCLQCVRGEIAGIEKQRETLNTIIPKCLVTTAGPPRVVKLLHRGNWQDTTGDEMLPAVPHFLATQALTDDAAKRRLTRLDLANWIVSRDNPLTARVYVNRLWRLYFGTGLSKILDDLGSQGEWPVHPELMDWLAVDLMDHGWDTKHLIKLLVSSGTYRQSSRPSDAATERDPFNRLLAHQSRWRLDAEFVRDGALFVSGLLVDREGGPSAKPYQPAGYWDQLNFPARTYVSDKGDNEYRRGLYTWWQRSFTHPSLVAFDAPSREESVCERNRSNIPQQALVLLNDPTYVEASRAFAARIIHEGGATTADRLRFAFQTALSRSPRADETRVLSDLLDKHLKEFSARPEDAASLLAVGDAPTTKDAKLPELAAWTSIARVIFNVHEVITRN